MKKQEPAAGAEKKTPAAGADNFEKPRARLSPPQAPKKMKKKQSPPQAPETFEKRGLRLAQILYYLKSASGRGCGANDFGK